MQRIEPPARELLALIQDPNLYVLVPKRRGRGFLKTPLGHHATALGQLETKIGADIVGLDGHLAIALNEALPAPTSPTPAARRSQAEKAMDFLSRHYGIP